jgi:hypothetical protein
MPSFRLDLQTMAVKDMISPKPGLKLSVVFTVSDAHAASNDVLISTRSGFFNI